MRTSIYSPSVLFTIIWLFLLILHDLNFFNIYIEQTLVHRLTVLLVIVSMLIGCIIVQIFYAKKLYKKQTSRRYMIHHFKVKINHKLFLKIAIIGYLIEGMYHKGFPLLSILGVLNYVQYHEFGIPGLHGLLNSFLYAGWLLCVFEGTINKRWNSKKWMITAIFITMLLLSRQMLMTLLLQAFLVNIMNRGLNVKRFVYLLLLVIFTLFLFAYLGGIRSGNDGISTFSGSQSEINFLKIAFSWVYFYITSPINNFFYNLQIESYYLPLNTISSFFPNFVRSFLFNVLEFERIKLDLPYEIFNATTFIAKYYIDFGLHFISFYFIILGVVTEMIYLKAKYSLRYLCILVVILHGIIFSFFADLLFHIVFLFQIFLISIVKITYFKESRDG